MADNKTEKATPRRRDKIRKEGKIPRSRELSSAFALMSVLCLLHWSNAGWVEQWHDLMNRLLNAAAQSDISSGSSVLAWTGMTAFKWIWPAATLGFGVAVMVQFMQGGIVFAPAALTPNLAKMNPAQNIKQIFSLSGYSRLLKSLVPLAIVIYLSYVIISAEWTSIIHASAAGLAGLPGTLVGHLWEIGWKGAFVFTLWAVVDYVLQRRKFENDLKMSKQEVRDEGKETEGNPQAKGRMRRMQRQMRKKRMLQDVKKATVVITNPTHFAVALRYDLETMGAPVVVAKGQDLVAKQIRQIAQWHDVPLVENPPLARTLYRSVDVGSVIPSKLYTAVAEILAFVYRAQAQAAQRNGGKA
ncbi:MAG TPA: flagellar biosynthesis protein FlhB [Candidatus Angelobacter sp.]|nr:flagellar biosynthesis protein FlhB [Candidatus Angelobacter sp.]